MKRTNAYTKIVLTFILATAVLTACLAYESTPQAPLAEVVTASSQASNTPTATQPADETAVRTHTLTPLPSTTQVESTPIPTETPSLSVSAPFLSSQGQLAFIKNQMLYVETAVNSAIFREIGSSIASMLWSPQGDKLIFETCDLSSQTYCIEPVWMLYDFMANALIDLNEQIPDIPRRHFGIPAWSESGDKILCRMILEGDIFLLDLAEGEFIVILDSLRLPLDMWELPNEKLLIQNNLGTGANELHAYDFSGTKIWSFPNIRSWGIEGGNNGILGFSEEGQLLIILGPDENLNELATLYHFNTNTFDVERLATYPILPGAGVNISPDGQFVALYIPIEQGNYEDSALMIVDQNGRSYGQRPNSFIIDWRPGGGPIIESITEGLVYWPLDGTEAQIFHRLESTTFGEGKWSGDGRFFIYNTVDETNKQSHLYLWQPENDAPTLLQSAEGTDGFRNFAWLPDSSGVYFNWGRAELWQFEVETESLSLIASSEDK